MAQEFKNRKHPTRNRDHITVGIIIYLLSLNRGTEFECKAKITQILNGTKHRIGGQLPKTLINQCKEMRDWGWMKIDDISDPDHPTYELKKLGKKMAQHFLDVSNGLEVTRDSEIAEEMKKLHTFSFGD